MRAGRRRGIDLVAALRRVQRGRAWRSRPGWALTVGVVALAVRAPLLGHSFISGDSVGYLRVGAALFDGQGFAVHYWTPGYPALLGLIGTLTGKPAAVTVAIQHLVGAGLVVAILLVAWRFFGQAVAILAGSLAALAPAFPYAEHLVLPDTLFAAAIFAGAAILASGLAEDPDSRRAPVIAGTVFGLSCYIRPTGQVLLFAVPLAYILHTRDLRRTVIASAVAAAAMIVVILPWVVRNAVNYGDPVLSDVTGSTLWARAFDQDFDPVPGDSPEARLGRRVVHRVYRGKPPGVPQPSAHYVLAAFLQHGYSETHSMRSMSTIALTAIRKHPYRFLRGTWGNLQLYASSVGKPTPVELSYLAPWLAASDSPAPKGLSWRPWSFSKLLQGIWWILSLHALAALLCLFGGSNRARAAAAVFISVWLAVALSGALIVTFETRYAVEIAPFAWITGSAGLMLVVRAIWDGMRPRRESLA